MRGHERTSNAFRLTNEDIRHIIVFNIKHFNRIPFSISTSRGTPPGVAWQGLGLGLGFGLGLGLGLAVRVRVRVWVSC